MNSNIQFKNIFEKNEKITPKFDFWYLIKNAPKYTANSLQWFVYPLVFLLMLMSVKGLVSDLYVGITDENIGFGLMTFIKPGLGIGIALLLWVGIARDGQVKDAIRDFYVKFQLEYKNNPLNDTWRFHFLGSKDLHRSIENLSRGNSYAAKVKYCFENQSEDYHIIIGDLTRTRQPSATEKQGYREDFSFLIFDGLAN
jgi:hypothetical protein